VPLVGSSLGAQIGLHLARDEACLVRTLAVVDPPHLTEPTTQSYMERVAREVFPANEKHLESEHSGQRPGHARSVLLRNFMLDKSEIPRDQVEAVELAGSIGCPTLIAGGDDDPVFPIRRAIDLCERIPNSELFILPRAGHFPHNSMPSVFNEVLLGFLRRHS
jgi:pimeloyl-ACP methyl ester carboxylesterase